MPIGKFKPQNLLNRVQAGGFSIDNAVNEIQSKIPNLSTPGNIDINGSLASISSQAQSAVNGAVQQLAGKVKSRFRRVDADEFTVATLLPVARFKKAQQGTVYSDSRKMI